jgi:hypothetical protein
MENHQLQVETARCNPLKRNENGMKVTALVGPGAPRSVQGVYPAQP